MTETSTTSASSMKPILRAYAADIERTILEGRVALRSRTNGEDLTSSQLHAIAREATALGDLRAELDQVRRKIAEES